MYHVPGQLEYFFGLKSCKSKFPFFIFFYLKFIFPNLCPGKPLFHSYIPLIEPTHADPLVIDMIYGAGLSCLNSIFPVRKSDN